MMRIEVDIQNLRFAATQNMGNGNGNVIIDAETRSSLSPCMMQPPCRVKDMQRAFFTRTCFTSIQSHHRAQCDERTTRDTRRYLMHTCDCARISFSEAVFPG